MIHITYKEAERVAQEYSKLFWLEFIENQKLKDKLLSMYKKMIFGNLSLMERMKLREKIAVLEKDIFPGGFE